MPDPAPFGPCARDAAAAVAAPARVHVRLSDQRIASGPEFTRNLAEALPPIVPFPGCRYEAMFAVLDWDHRIPSEVVFLRILAAYDEGTARRIDEALAARDRAIGEGNLFPEFDVPDYGGIDASEQYLAVVDPQDASIEALRLVGRRRQVEDDGLVRRAAAALEQSEPFRAADAARGRDRRRLGGAMVAGWAPPCTSGADRWCLEFWLLTRFDGQMGSAHVFYVDPDTFGVVVQSTTAVQVA